jgi:hypothetical protein
MQESMITDLCCSSMLFIITHKKIDWDHIEVTRYLKWLTVLH